MFRSRLANWGFLLLAVTTVSGLLFTPFALAQAEGNAGGPTQASPIEQPSLAGYDLQPESVTVEQTHALPNGQMVTQKAQFKAAPKQPEGTWLVPVHVHGAIGEQGKVMVNVGDMPYFIEAFYEALSNAKGFSDKGLDYVKIRLFFEKKPALNEHQTFPEVCCNSPDAMCSKPTAEACAGTDGSSEARNPKYCKNSDLIDTNKTKWRYCLKDKANECEADCTSDLVTVTIRYNFEDDELSPPWIINKDRSWNYPLNHPFIFNYLTPPWIQRSYLRLSAEPLRYRLRFAAIYAPGSTEALWRSLIAPAIQTALTTGAAAAGAAATK